MSEDKSEETQPKPLNTVSDETGQLDPQFMLWRSFCVENDVDVNLLTSQLSKEQREKWNEFKNGQDKAK